MLGFQWLIARRYFALARHRSTRKLIRWPIGFGVPLLALQIFLKVLAHSHNFKLQQLRQAHEADLQLAWLVALVVFCVVTYFVLLVRRLTIFTTISVFGLFLGTAALVIVLSVMSGFEQDLKHKILGTRAHITVTKLDGPFTDYVALRQKMSSVPDVLGASAYIDSEVMITSYSNQSGVIIKGIDVATVGQVTDVAKNTDVGDLGYLDHPEKLRTLGGPSLFEGEAQKPKSDDKDGDKPTAKDGDKPTAKDGDKPTARDGDKKKTSDDDEEQRLVPSHRRPEAEPEGTPRRLLQGVIVGRELARSLRVYLGDDVNLISPFGGIGPSGPIPKSKPFRVAGIFFSGMFEYDNTYTYVSLAAAQKFFNMDGEVTGIELKVRDPDRPEEVVARLKQLVGPGYDVEDWKELNRSLFSALKIEKILMFVLLCFIILVAAFSIIANGTMLVMEKGKEVAILKSMGASDSSILVTFVLLGFCIGCIGIVSGLVVGVVSCWALGRYGLPLNPDVYYITSLPVQMNPYEIFTIFVAALAITLLATLYPAWMAARLRPVDGLRDSQ